MAIKEVKIIDGWGLKEVADKINDYAKSHNVSGYSVVSQGTFKTTAFVNIEK